MNMRFAIAALLAAGLLAAGQAGAAVLQSDTSICDTAQKQYREGNNAIDRYDGAPDLDPQLALLRHLYINTIMTRQLIALSVIQWYNCDLPASPLPPLPTLDIDTFLETAQAAAGAEEMAVLSEGKLKRNRTRILVRLRDVAAINALPAACAGSSAFAATDIQELFDSLYQIGYNTADVYYFQTQYETAFATQLDAFRLSIRQAGFDTICDRDMTAETTRGFEKIEEIRELVR